MALTSASRCDLKGEAPLAAKMPLCVPMANRNERKDTSNAERLTSAGRMKRQR
jgi:hypothetical protein